MTWDQAQTTPMAVCHPRGRGNMRAKHLWSATAGIALIVSGCVSVATPQESPEAVLHPAAIGTQAPLTSSEPTFEATPTPTASPTATPTEEAPTPSPSPKPTPVLTAPPIL